MALKTLLISVALLAITVPAQAALGKTRGFATAKATLTDWADNTCEIDQAELKTGFYGAVSEAKWDAGNVCGKCIEVRSIQGRALTKTFLVKIVDFCTDCGAGDLDLSPKTLAAIEGVSKTKKRIEWQWVSCTPTERGALDSGTGRAMGRKML